MPGSGQWRIITKQPVGEKECWICDKQVYSLIFWNELIGAVQAKMTPTEDRDWVIQKIQDINRFVPPPPAYQSHKDKIYCPYIYG